MTEEMEEEMVWNTMQLIKQLDYHAVDKTAVDNHAVDKTTASEK